MITRVAEGELRVARELHDFVRLEALPGTGLDERGFWSGAAEMVGDLRPGLNALLQERVAIQAALDVYNSDQNLPKQGGGYEAFLRSIEYVVPEPEDFEITTTRVDQEISSQPGPQLVVPLLNARFATNAANARWGSLYDALYGTDAVPESGRLARSRGYNPARGDEVIGRGRRFLDEIFPLTVGSHRSATSYEVGAAGLVVHQGEEVTVLQRPEAFIGYIGPREGPSSVVLVHHGLHVILEFDRGHQIGARDAAGICDIVVEAAVTAIMDLEDSVAAVDASDKVRGYRNWLGLMQGTLTAEVVKKDASFTRRLHADRVFRTTSGGVTTLKGTALLMVRHVGHHMTTDSILDSQGNEVPEGIVDALITAVCGLHDLRGPRAGSNSRVGSIYVVKPKMHGPKEVAFACELLRRTEQLLGLEACTIKIGIMDEERRTSANLKACIHAASDRVAFINTGFLDRTGDEIHSSLLAGPMVRKAAMKRQPWMREYETQNVSIGLSCGFRGRAQIGKGMWPAPDNMAEMLEQKVSHPLSGASCAWVPSPTAATLHALHYHAVDVLTHQAELARPSRHRNLAQLLTVPLGNPDQWTSEQRSAEIDNNIQGILGYAVRWVNDGVGCSKVPDIDGTPLMEDRATCRISSQIVANWLQHGVVDTEQVEDSLRRMALVVDAQNADQPAYQPMAPSYDGSAFLAARELVMSAAEQPCGYTELVLRRWRRIQKRAIPAKPP
ncbi:malate synthase G [Angustibacter luteus]|uniref:Malate synthase G n=1 Tax=Angustibacter luteus TaxID=658456 RepID=A0ABW1JDU9_9ACTN